MAAIELATSWRYVTEPMLRDQSLLSSALLCECVCVCGLAGSELACWCGLLPIKTICQSEIYMTASIKNKNEEQTKKKNQRRKTRELLPNDIRG